MRRRRCVYCGDAATTRFRVARVPWLGIIGWVLGELALRRARWRWTCDRHTVDELRAALRAALGPAVAVAETPGGEDGDDRGGGP